MLACYSWGHEVSPRCRIVRRRINAGSIKFGILNPQLSGEGGRKEGGGAMAARDSLLGNAIVLTKGGDDVGDIQLQRESAHARIRVVASGVLGWGAVLLRIRGV